MWLQIYSFGSLLGLNILLALRFTSNIVSFHIAIIFLLQCFYNLSLIILISRKNVICIKIYDKNSWYFRELLYWQYCCIQFLSQCRASSGQGQILCGSVLYFVCLVIWIVFYKCQFFQCHFLYCRNTFSESSLKKFLLILFKNYFKVIIVYAILAISLNTLFYFIYPVPNFTIFSSSYPNFWDVIGCDIVIQTSIRETWHFTKWKEEKYVWKWLVIEILVLKREWEKEMSLHDPKEHICKSD